MAKRAISDCFLGGKFYSKGTTGIEWDEPCKALVDEDSKVVEKDEPIFPPAIPRKPKKADEVKQASPVKPQA